MRVDECSVIHGGIDCSVRYRHSPCPGESVVVGERAVTPITTFPRYATCGRRLLHDHAVDVRCCDDAGCWEVLSPPWTGVARKADDTFTRCGVGGAPPTRLTHRRVQLDTHMPLPHHEPTVS